MKSFPPAKYPAVERTIPTTQSVRAVIIAVFAVLFILMHLLSYKSVDQTSDPICTPFADIYSQKTCEDSNSRHQESTSDHHTGCCSRFQDQRAPNPDGHNTSGYRRNAGNTNRKNHCRNSEDHRSQHCKNKCQKCQADR